MIVELELVRLEAIERDLRGKHREMAKVADTKEKAKPGTTASYERGRAYGYDDAAGEVADLIAEIKREER